jgi:hypothetical protein
MCDDFRLSACVAAPQFTDELRDQVNHRGDLLTAVRSWEIGPASPGVAVLDAASPGADLAVG